MTYHESSAKQGWAGGLSLTAAAILLIVGILEFFQGLSAVVTDDIFVVGQQYIYEFDVSTWGWIHLIIGIIVALTGFGLFFGMTVARVLAIVFLSLSVIANFLWIPYYPWWSITLIALAVIGIWAVTAWEPDAE